MDNAAGTRHYDAAGLVAVDQPCLRCGYNLRMQPRNGRCPECGESVAFTMSQPLLSLADAGWVRGLFSGVGLLLGALAVMVGASCAFWIGLGVIVPSAGSASISSPDVAIVTLLAVALSLVVTGMIISGLVRLSRPDPGSPAWGDVPRRLLRAGAIAMGALLLLQVGVQIFIAANHNYSPSSAPSAAFGSGVLLSMLLGAIAAIVWLTVLATLFWYFRILMKRIPNPGLVTFATVQFWGSLAIGVLLTLWLVVIQIILVTSLLPAMASFAASMPTTAPASMPAGVSVSVTNGSSSTSTYTSVGTLTTLPATTNPTSTPTSFPSAALPPGFALFGAVTAVGAFLSCGGLIAVLAGATLTMFVWIALRDAARTAAKIAAGADPR